MNSIKVVVGSHIAQVTFYLIFEGSGSQNIVGHAIESPHRSLILLPNETSPELQNRIEEHMASEYPYNTWELNLY